MECSKYIPMACVQGTVLALVSTLAAEVAQVTLQWAGKDVLLPATGMVCMQQPIQKPRIVPPGWFPWLDLCHATASFSFFTSPSFSSPTFLAGSCISDAVPCGKAAAVVCDLPPISALASCIPDPLPSLALRNTSRPSKPLPSGSLCNAVVSRTAAP